MDEASLAWQALLAAAGCARRLERPQKKLAQRFPMNAATIAALPPATWYREALSGGAEPPDAALGRLRSILRRVTAGST